MVDPFSNVGCEFFMQVLVLYGLSFKIVQFPTQLAFVPVRTGGHCFTCQL